MEGIKTIALNICIVMIITGIFSVLIPAKNFEKILKFAISLFFVASVAIPMMNGELEFNFTTPDSYENYYKSSLSQGMDDSVRSVSEEYLTLAIAEVLEINSIIPKKIDVSVNISEDGRIDINNVSITITENDEIFNLKIKEIILREVGVTPQIEIQ